MRRYLFFFIALFLPLMTSASEETDDNGVVVDVNGVKMSFVVIDADQRTVQIGDGKEVAIPSKTSGALVIPSEVTLDSVVYKVVSVADLAFSGCRSLTAVEIPSSITYFGRSAFLNCSGLKKVIAPDLRAWCAISFKNLYSNPLYYAGHFYSDQETEITTLVIPNNVARIGNFAFARCNIKMAIIAGSVRDVMNSSFYKCTDLTSVHFAEGVKNLNSNAFYGCTSLTTVTLPEGLMGIGPYAFYECTSLQSVNLPGSLTGVSSSSGIGKYAFKNCRNLKSVTSHIQSPSLALGESSFASIDPSCILYIPVGKLTAYINSGWTKSIFGGGIVEIGDVEENRNVENPVTNDFITNVVYPDDDYSFTSIADYTATMTDYRKDLPWPVRIEVPTTFEGEEMVLETYDDGQLVRCDTFLVGQRALEIWNLIPKKTYTYNLYLLSDEEPGLLMDDDGVPESKKLLASGSFDTEGQVRMMNIENVNNFRDLGGWPLPHGRHVKYDRLFRSAEFEQTQQIINEAGIYEMLTVQGIGVEIDFGDFSDNSPVERFLEFVHGPDYQLNPYVDGIISTPEQYKNCFEKVVESLQAGKKVLFHCSEGADRTGTFAFFLEGLLGVSESDMAKDYELTDFYMDSKTTESKKRYRNNWYMPFVQYVKDTYTGNTLNEKIEQMALGMGISKEHIDIFRSLMIDGDFVAGVNTLKGTDMKAVAGQRAVLPIEMTNEDVVRSCHFDLRLPEGVKVATKSNGRLDVKLAERAENYSVKSQQMENGDYRFIIASVDEEDMFMDNNGILMEVTVEVPDTMEAGDYEVKVLNAELSVADGNGVVAVKLDDAESRLTVSSKADDVQPTFTPGDVNDDASVTVTDVGCTINYLLEQVPSAFNFEAADMNGDGVITVTDVGMIINLILYLYTHK